MKRLHIHVSVDDLTRAVGFYSGLLGAKPCCRGSNFANWRVDEPPVNFAASIGHGPVGGLHLGLEVDGSDDLRPIDRVLHSAARSAAGLPWEVSVRKQPVQKAFTR
jgi:catechol 2,3-dioxygenase-like lactoylglutathione lyase family enzyme